MANISSDAKKVLQAAGIGAKDYVLSQGGFGSRLTSGEAKRLLAGFKASPYSARNVAQAVTNPSPTYNYNDPYGARTAIEKRLGYDQATAAEQAAQKALLGFQDTTRATINKLRSNRDLSTGLEAGFEAQRTREATQQEQALANELQLAQNARIALENKVSQEYNVYQQERADREELMLKAIQAGAKNVNMGMTTKQLANAYTKAVKDKQREEEKKAEEKAKDEYKKNLKSTLLQLGLSTKTSKGGTLSTSKMEDKLKDYYASESDYKRKIEQLDLAAKQKALSGGGGTTGGNSAYNQALALKNQGLSWGDAAAKLSKKFDLAPGSEASRALDAVYGGMDYYNQLYGGKQGSTWNTLSSPEKTKIRSYLSQNGSADDLMKAETDDNFLMWIYNKANEQSF